MKFDCETPGLEQVLERMARTVRAAGGWLSPHLTVHERGGDLSLRSDLAPERHDVLAAIPEPCFLPLGEVRLALAGGRITVKSLPPGYGETRTALLRGMIEAYNLTGKLAAYRSITPRYVFRGDPEMLERLTAGRPGTGAALRMREFENERRPERLLLEHFIRTRNLKLGPGGDQIIPVLDFVNHHTLARRVERKTQPGGGTSAVLLNFKPVPGSDQVFARYGRFDAYDTYLMFGFAARPASHLLSVPCALRLAGGGVIEAGCEIGAGKRRKGARKAPGPGFYAPRIEAARPGYRKVSALVVPGSGAPLALRRVLAHLIGGMRPGLGEAALKSLIAEAESAVLAANRRFFSGLADYLAARGGDYAGEPAFRMAREMCAIQLEALEQYRKNLP